MQFRKLWFFLHFLLISGICCRETLWLIAPKSTSTQPEHAQIAAAVKPISATRVGRDFSSSNSFRHVLLAYIHLAGIDHGYGYFAPNIPSAFKLVFELHYPDGRVGYELPRFGHNRTDLHLATLLDEIGRTESTRYREYLIRRVALSVWRKHADAISIRAVLGISLSPTPAEFEKGARESYKFVDAYDFNLRNGSGRPQQR